MPYLKHKETGEVYPLNEHLLKRGDFIEVESLDADLPKPELEEFVIETTPKVAPKAKRKPKAKAEPVVEAPAPKAKRKPKAKAEPVVEAPAPAVEPDDVDVDVSDLLDDLPEDFGED